jgi:hypothetical protein
VSWTRVLVDVQPTHEEPKFFVRPIGSLPRPGHQALIPCCRQLPSCSLAPSTRVILAGLGPPDEPFGGGPNRTRPAPRPRTTCRQRRAILRQATTSGPPSLRASTRVPSSATGARQAVPPHSRRPAWLHLDARNWLFFVARYQPITKFGFAYGTLPDHTGSGEERFLIEWDQTDESVWYDILAFSRPQHLLVRLGYPMLRRRQKRFGRESAAVMLRTIKKVVP